MDQELSDGIRVLARLALLADRICAKSGISLVQYRLLFVITEEPLRAGPLADRLAVSRPTLTAAINALVDRGLVVREAVVGDGRGVKLRVTDDGAQVLDRVEHRIVGVLGIGASDDEVGRAMQGLVPLRRSLDMNLEATRRAHAVVDGRTGT